MKKLLKITTFTPLLVVIPAIIGLFLFYGPATATDISTSTTTSTTTKFVTLSINKSSFYVGERWTLILRSNIPNKAVTICSRVPSPSGNSCTPAADLGLTANTNSLGDWTASGIPTNNEMGQWIEYAIVDGTTSNDINFRVIGTHPPTPTATQNAI